MIRFSCVCSQTFEAPEDQAGTAFQCPVCHRLVDVPTLSELESISTDGTYKIDADPEPRTTDQQLQRVSELERVFTRHRQDEYGREIDLRNTAEEIRQAGTVEIPLELKDQVQPGAPKYDPITGELIRPLDVKRDEVDTSKGLWTGPPLRYSNDPLPLTGPRMFLELFQLPNLAVMVGVLLMHFMIQIMLFPLSVKFVILVPFLLLIIGGLFSHYANVIEETGPTHSDELPRPLRDLSWGDDLWGPFSRFMLALLCAYGVAFTMFYLPKPARLPFFLVVAGAGSSVFPALLLTTTTSGSIMNLRPDRVMRVIRACGPAYLLIVIGWIAFTALYVFAFLGTSASFLHFFDRDQRFPYDWFLSPLITYPALFLAVFCMHALMWYLGLQYRDHQGEFGWILQAHERSSNAPPKRGFEVRRSRRHPVPVAAQPVIPIDEETLVEETPQQAELRRQRLFQQAAEAQQRQQQLRPPPDDHFDVDELLKP